MPNRHPRRWTLCASLLVATVVRGRPTRKLPEPAGRADAAFDFADLLSSTASTTSTTRPRTPAARCGASGPQARHARQGHQRERGQPFPLDRAGARLHREQRRFFVGLRLWPGAEAYFVPELIAEKPLSSLVGLGSAIQNFELQKNGVLTPAAVFVAQLSPANDRTPGKAGSRRRRTSTLTASMTVSRSS